MLNFETSFFKCSVLCFTLSVLPCISFTVVLESLANFLICSATTEKPFPASPALADSIAAFNAKRLV
jgi:hypothetical protein